MAGSGTQQDPYIVSSWNELLLFNETDTYVRFVEDSDVDFLKVYPDGLSSNLNILCNIDGNNITWKNLYLCNAGQLSFYGTVDRLKFLNFYFRPDATSCLCVYNNWSHVTLTGVVYATNECALFSSGEEVSILHDIAANLRLYGKQVSMYADSNIQLTYSQIHLEGSATSAIGIYKGTTSTSSDVFCKYTGKLQCEQSSNSYHIFSNNAASECNVYDLEVSYIVSDNVDQLTNISVYNNEKITASTSSVFIGGCTSEQLNDKTYLRSLGFPVGA